MANEYYDSEKMYKTGDLGILKTIKPLEDSFDKQSIAGHKDWAEKYYSYNNYHFALFEYENCLIINKVIYIKTIILLLILLKIFKPIFWDITQIIFFGINIFFCGTIKLKSYCLLCVTFFIFHKHNKW